MSASKVLKYIGCKLAEELIKCGSLSQIEELRLRKDCPAIICASGKEMVLKTVTDSLMIKNIILSMTSHSIAAYSEDIKNGYFTIEDGIRIGVAGKAVTDNGEIKMLREFSSVNIRFPSQLIGIHRNIKDKISRNGDVCSLLIVSSPQFGKTTLLRDVIRAVSLGEGFIPKKVCVIDERMEIYASGKFDLGIRADVLSACPKSQGIKMALRSLSPEVLAMDEIGDERDLEALFEAGNCGIKVIATAHAGSMEELKERLFFTKLIASGFIERIVLLSESLGRGTVEDIYDKSCKSILSGPIKLTV